MQAAQGERFTQCPKLSKDKRTAIEKVGFLKTAWAEATEAASGPVFKLWGSTPKASGPLPSKATVRAICPKGDSTMRDIDIPR